MKYWGFTYEYVAKRVRLSWHDILYAIEKNFLSPEDAIKNAMVEISERDQYSQVLFELASLNPTESVHTYLRALVDIEPIQDDKIASDKFLYLILDWLFDNKDKYSDSLGIIERIYTDFDYPEQITTFVRYTPSDEPGLGTRELNEARLYKKWKQYLDEQKKRFWVI